MIEHGDSKLREHSRKMKEYRKKYPERDWKYNLTEEQIKEIEESRRKDNK